MWSQLLQDGLATVRWIAKQPWFRPGAKVNIFGVSYLGFAAWAANAAVAAAHDAAGGHDASIPEVASLMPVMTSSCMHNGMACLLSAVLLPPASHMPTYVHHPDAGGSLFQCATLTAAQALSFYAAGPS